MKNFSRSLVVGCSALALASCGGDEIVSPGTGGDIIINNPTPTPTGTPTPTPTGGTVTAAGGCPTIAASGGLTDDGTITGPTGTYRVCVLPSTIDTDTNLPYIAGLLYAMDGRVDVGEDGGRTPDGTDGLDDTDVTLSLEPGVVVFAGNATTPNGESYLVVNRGNEIDAVGTADMPIIFTSRDNVLGLATDSSIGQWGGVVLLGRAPVSDCRDGVPNKANQADCEQELEGAAITTLFGGNTPADSSGTMDYVQIRYSGYTLTGGSELQSLTTGGIGSGTSVNHFMSFNSSDDGMEFFGGTVKMKYVVAVGADDDSIDVDTGAQADMQHVIVKQRSNGGDHIVELDSPDGDYSVDALPRTNLRISNATMVAGSSAASRSLRLRGGADFSLVNSVLDSVGAPCLRIDEADTIAANVGDGAPFFASVAADCSTTEPFQASSGVTVQQVADLFNNSADTDAAFDVVLTSGFINSDAINAWPVYNANAGISTFFDTVDHIGAVKDAADDWWAGWTCDSATLTFGDGTGACTTLPVY